MRFYKNHINIKNENIIEFVSVKIRPEELQKIISILNQINTKDSIELKENFLRIEKISRKNKEEEAQEKKQGEKDVEDMLKAIEHCSKNG